MKNKVLFPVIFLVLVFATSCQKQVDESAENQSLTTTSENLQSRKIARVDINKEAYKQMIAENEARLALLNSDASRAGCVHTAVVPDDYLTIQEAMDAVCKNGNIIVKAGTYDGNVLISKPGLNIEAVGDVTVNGTFWFYSYIDRVTIQKFIIKPVYNGNPGSYNGIYGYGIQGAKFIKNTIIGTGNDGFGIVLTDSKHNLIIDNQVSDFAWGIVFNTEYVSSNNNTIQDNTVTGITQGSCIGLEGNCDNNLIAGNIVTKNSNPENGGICLISDASGAYQPDHNILKNNTVTYNFYTGIFIDGGLQNSIGSGNICKNTDGPDGIGLYLTATTSKTQVINNTVLHNTICDIVYEYGADVQFNNNTYGCFEGN